MFTMHVHAVVRFAMLIDFDFMHIEKQNRVLESRKSKVESIVGMMHIVVNMPPLHQHVLLLVEAWTPSLTPCLYLHQDTNTWCKPKCYWIYGMDTSKTSFDLSHSIYHIRFITFDLSHSIYHTRNEWTLVNNTQDPYAMDEDERCSMIQTSHTQDRARQTTKSIQSTQVAMHMHANMCTMYMQSIQTKHPHMHANMYAPTCDHAWIYIYAYACI